MSRLDQRISQLRQRTTLRQIGHVTKALGTSIFVEGLDAEIGDICRINSADGEYEVSAEVVGIQKNAVVLSPLGPLRGISVGSQVEILPEGKRILFSDQLLGRVVDCNGQPIDGGNSITTGRTQPVYTEAPDPMTRVPINARMDTGVTAIDQLNPLGYGQRIGLFAKAGLGKSTLTSMIARNASADVTVIALIGERGREVNDLIHHGLGPEVLASSVLVVSTSDKSAAERVKAANTATAIAEAFQQEGKNVLLVMDSLTRYARALREMGLAAGEAPSRRGFPPSVFSELPKLFERVGNGPVGSITAVYSVLIEDDEAEDPITEEVKSLLDGHLFLSPELSARGHFPAIDINSSVSRLAARLQEPNQQAVARDVKMLVSKYKEVELLLQLGEYTAGNDPQADRAIALREAIDQCLQQQTHERINFQQKYAEITHMLQSSQKVPEVEQPRPIEQALPPSTNNAVLDELRELIGERG